MKLLKVFDIHSQFSALSEERQYLDLEKCNSVLNKYLDLSDYNKFVVIVMVSFQIPYATSTIILVMHTLHYYV